MVTPPIKLTTTLPAPPKRRMMVSSVETAVLVIAAVLLYLYLLKPNQARLEQTQNVQAELQTKKDSLEDQKRDFESIQRKVQDPANASLLDQLDAALPLKDYVPRLYAALENVTERSAIRGASIRIDFDQEDLVPAAMSQEPGTNREVTALPASISGAATVDQMQLLLGFVENSARILSVKNLELKPGTENLLLFNLDLEAYSYLPAKEGVTHE